MTLYKPGTNIRFTDLEYIDWTLARLDRIARKGVHPGRYIFYEHEVRECLLELVREVRENVIALLEERLDAPAIDYKQNIAGEWEKAF